MNKIQTPTDTFLHEIMFVDAAADGVRIQFGSTVITLDDTTAKAVADAYADRKIALAVLQAIANT
jgi:hypothetical protein